MPGENNEPEKKGLAKQIFMYLLFGIMAAAVIVLFLLAYPSKNSNPFICGDGTFYDSCSLTKPYFCSEGELIVDEKTCGCASVFKKEDGVCKNSLFTDPKEISLKYILDGEEKYISFKMYPGVEKYVSGLPKFLVYGQGETPRRDDFKLMKLDDETQRDALMPLVVAIQNTAPNSVEDQARIAISIVQNIPYGESEATTVFGKFKLRISNYPYITLASYEGSCESKSEVLAFLLRELGYGVSLFYYANESHESVGIKCPLEYSLHNSGYCFVETTVPSPISYSTGKYLGIVGGKLKSEPEIVIVSKGISLPSDMYEYKDAEDLDDIMSSYEKKGQLNFFEKNQLDELRAKYGLKY